MTILNKLNSNHKIYDCIILNNALRKCMKREICVMIVIIYILCQLQPAFFKAAAGMNI